MRILGRGDSGYTDLLGAERVPKYDERVEACGTLDEATSALGMARAAAQTQRVRELLQEVQMDFYVIMAELATPARLRDRLGERIATADVDRVEAATREVQAQLMLPACFILPGACQASAALDFGRAVVRRAERQVAKLVHGAAADNREMLRYLNRASSLLYMLARYEEASQGIPYSLAERRRREKDEARE